VADDLSLDLFEEDEDDASDVDVGLDGAENVSDSDDGLAAPSAVREPKVWSVHQVNKAVRGLLESSVEPLWVGGEVGNWTRSRAGHCYFTLKDERAQLRAVMWAREAARLPIDPEEGTKVRVNGTLTLYEVRGDVQFTVRKLEVEGGDGLWRKAFEELKARLEAEGLLEPARKRPLPRYPGCIGVVTSPTGAALHDILSVLGRRAPWARVVLAGARVQGEGASAEIAGAIERLAASGLPDVMIVGRGGGSIEDLWAFNEEPVARAIAACPVPVVSAVGHEVDVTISDLVADLRAPTPSAAAEAVVPDAQVLLGHLARAPERMGRALRRTAARPRVEVRERLSRLARSIERRLAPARQTLDMGAARLERRMTTLVTARRARAAALTGRLEALSPLSTLARGYAVARAQDGAVLRTVADFEPGRRFRLRVEDGTVEAETIETEPLDAGRHDDD
jgi:exodeoxyribonuclease VII large subunit